ncbi:hypothetical protein COLO4_24988 [Corchorus olitorius]|uniref:Uncharacterized protein n=1 Tax=Corchorus olitorius TaxID=93759 RepID=A0A1R3I5I5_9ROSI|nr:hypothetical protein COLO4_24988 [Corchorus olitorius]
MEKLKCLVPESVKRRVAESSCDDLACLSSSVVDLFLSLPEFHQLIADLIDSNQNHNLCEILSIMKVLKRIVSDNLFAQGAL